MHRIVLVASFLFLCPLFTVVAAETSEVSLPGDAIAQDSGATAQTRRDDTGFAVKFGVDASFIHRVKPIRFGMLNSLTPFISPPLRAISATPSITVGYRFSESNRLSLELLGARYSVDRTAFHPGHNGFTISGGNPGFFGVGPGNLTRDRIEWRSDVVNSSVEYTHTLWSDARDRITVSGMLGGKYRFEGQRFLGHAIWDGRPFDPAATATDTVQKVNETLNEHLYGPLSGIMVTAKPNASFQLSSKTDVGYLFKSALFRGRQAIFPTNTFASRHVANDKSTKATVYFRQKLDVSYAIVKNVSVDMHYGYELVNQAANIRNTMLFRVPTRIENTALHIHSIGFGASYQF